MDALKSGKYDPDKTALLITQTGGGCRASNYIHLLRKAVDRTYPQIPVVSLNFSGLEKDSAFRITAPMFLKLLHAVLYGDLLMNVRNRMMPYETVPGFEAIGEFKMPEPNVKMTLRAPYATDRPRTPAPEVPKPYETFDPAHSYGRKEA